MNTHTQHKQSNATSFSPMVVIVIALVIMGFLAAAYHFGSELMRAATIRDIAYKLAIYTRAAQGFEAKYDFLPGDIPDATTHKLADEKCGEGVGAISPSVPGCNGDGNGSLTTYTEHKENINFWHHMSRSGHLTAQYDGVTPNYGAGAPLLGLRNVGVAVGIAPSVFPERHVFALGLDDAGTNYYRLKPEEAQALDDKLDDGAAISGAVVVPDGFMPLCHDADGQYEVEQEATVCALFVKAEF